MDRVKDVSLESGWREKLGDELELPYMQKLKAFLKAEKKAGKVIYPRSDELFKALEVTAFSQVKIVILGQDPYHGPGQAHGLSFSVPKGAKIPPSLQNIFKELERDLQIPRPNHGDLQAWAEQGVLLLNSTLSVEQARAGSHQKRGWEIFTDRIIDALNRHREGIVFLLWGGYAQTKGRLIDTRKHLVLSCAHPSPLSAYRGFLGCGHFSQANAYLNAQGLKPIDWTL